MKSADEINRQKEVVAAMHQGKQDISQQSDLWEEKRRNLEFEVAVGRHLKDVQFEVRSRN